MPENAVSTLKLARLPSSDVEAYAQRDLAPALPAFPGGGSTPLGRQSRSNLTFLPQQTGLPGEVGSAGQQKESRGAAAVAAVLGRSTVPDNGLGPGGVYEGPVNRWWEKGDQKVPYSGGLAIGTQVRLHSLAREPTWNGAEGEVENFDRKSGLVRVLMPDGRVKCVNAENAEPIDELGRTRSVAMSHKAAKARESRTVAGFPGESLTPTATARGRERHSGGPPLPQLPNVLPGPEGAMNASRRSSGNNGGMAVGPNNWGDAPRGPGATGTMRRSENSAFRRNSREDAMLEDVQSQLDSITTRLGRNPQRSGRDRHISGMLA